MLYAIVAVIALIIDQAVKYWTTVNIVVDTGEAKLIPGLIHLANLHNTGAAFSFLEGARWFFVIVCLIFLVLIIYALAKNIISHPVCRWMSVIVMAGAVGNCIDRIVCGYVVDMFEFDFLIFGRPFPVFNVADIYITVGVIVFCIALLLEKPAGTKRAPAVSSEASAAVQRVLGTESAPTPAPEKRRSLRRHKVQIPTFEKHELPDIPVMDPKDPFAEWEKRAKAQSESETTTVYTQPEAAAMPTAEPAVEFRPAAPAKTISFEFPSEPGNSAKAAADLLKSLDQFSKPKESAPEQSKPNDYRTETADEFDLESILAEYKDL